MSVRTNKDDLNIILASHLTTIHETFQASYQTASSAFAKVTRDHVNKTGHQVSKQETTVGMLWGGKKPDSKVIEENMAVQLVQGLHCLPLFMPL